MKSIGIVVLYFGPFPNYFSLWIRSAVQNETVDFLIFSDQEQPCVASNIHFYKCSFEQMRMRIRKRLGRTCSIDRPYKLCDYKPAYGFLFEKELSGYDFWGYCDVDIVLGDLRAFLIDEVLNTYEKISNWGHLTLYKNIPSIVNRFQVKKTAASFTGFEAFRVPGNVAFDEKSGCYAFTEEGYYKTWINKTAIADIFPDTFHFRTYYNYYSDTRCIYEYDHGKLWGYFAEKDGIHKIEFMYIHLQARKMEMKTMDSEHYLIVPSGFYEYKAVTENRILEENEESLYGRTNVFLKTFPKIRIPFYIQILRKCRLFLFKYMYTEWRKE